MGELPTRRVKMRKKMRKVWGKIRKMIKIWGKMRKVELLPTRDCEADYGPARSAGSHFPNISSENKYASDKVWQILHLHMMSDILSMLKRLKSSLCIRTIVFYFHLLGGNTCVTYELNIRNDLALYVAVSWIGA